MPTVKELIQGAVVGALIEGPGAKQSLEEWSKKLDSDGEAIAARVLSSKDAQKAQSVLRHITGIEQWGQNRLRVFLGEPLLLDEYDGYQPAKNLTTEEQVAEFRKTRAETVDLVQKIGAAHTSTGTQTTLSEHKVQHNQMGPISLRGWLRYLDMHANWESKKIRS